MSTDQKSKIFITNLGQSSALAQKLAKAIKTPQLIELVGDLGGGKTSFVQALGRALGITKTITSPTFAIHQSYRIPRGGHLEHFDFYRLADDDIVANELSDVLADAGSVVCVEWAQNFRTRLADDRIIAEFGYINEDTRRLEFKATGQKSQKLLEALE